MNAQRATIQRVYDFEAAHRLPHVPDGHKCKTMHGHSYRIRVQVTGAVQQDGPEAGMVVDFGLLDAAANALCRKVDHTTLNETLHENPTVENMVPLVWAHFEMALCGARLEEPWRLRVWIGEGPRSVAVWPPEE
jgi:6-pyruvoyltetrahydropterin/6-carboxytetrahydropterin synthase